MTAPGKPWISCAIPRFSPNTSPFSQCPFIVSFQVYSSHFVSERGEGLFGMGLSVAAFSTLEAISAKAGDIYKRAIEEMDQLDPPPSASYREQLQLLLARLKPGSNRPLCQVSLVPGFASAPSASTRSVISFRY